VLASNAGTLAGADNVLWMGAVFHYEVNQGSAFLNLGLTSGGFITDRGRVLSTAGMDFMGVSNWAQPSNGWNTKLNATIVEDHVTGTGYSGSYVQALGSVSPTVTDMFVVLKYTFGTSDRVEAAFFTESEAISEAAFYAHPTYVSAVYAGDVDESALNTISYNQQLGDNALDEIRLGSTFNDLIGLASITSFQAASATGIINQSAKTINVTVPFGTDLSTLAPTFTLSSGTCVPTSGAAPSPTFAAQNPATYTVTDTSTDPDTVNNYTVTVTVAPPVTPTTTLVIDLGSGTVIEGGTFGTYGATNLPLPVLPAGSILRSIEVNTVLEATDNENFASDLAVLLDPTPGTPGGDFSVEITNGTSPFGATANLDWPSGTNVGPVNPLVDTKTDANWAAVAPIDLATTGLFLGNSWGGPTVGGTWSGTITLTYDDVSGGSPYDTWKSQITNGLDLRTDDADGDGFNNLQEFLYGTSPIAGNGALVTTTANGGNLVLRWLQRESGASYAFKQSSTLETDSWTTVVSPLPALDGDQTGAPTDYDYYTVTLPTGAGKSFFRIEGLEN
jgi:hypothetical protein